MYRQWVICEAHWHGHCSNRYHILVELKRVPDDFPERLRLLTKLLNEGSAALVRKLAPELAGPVPLDVFRPYLMKHPNPIDPEDTLDGRLPLLEDRS